MSNRRNALQGQPQSNPATKFLEWKSNERKFSFYDKEAGENKLVELPLNFVVLDELSFVKGWCDSLSGNIISNEVKYISKEVMTAKCYHKNNKGEKAQTEIAKGLYKDIKEKVNAAGAKYHKSVYLMLEDGTLANLQLKGAAVQAWGNFVQMSRKRLADEWITVSDVTEGKKGSVKYTTPNFKFLRSMSDSEAEQADSNFDTLEAYLKTYLVKSDPPEIEEENDDLDF